MALLTIPRLRQSIRDPADDGELLGRFLRSRDEAAFAELVLRHGAMVRGVCRRVTGTGADADDAFQAVFLVLARKASAVRPRTSVGAWLHGVAVRTALKARSRAARRRAVESAAKPRSNGSTDDADCSDAVRVLDEEIDRLPEALRTAVVLCELEGRSRSEVAARLGIPPGTLSSRLATARKRLADRLKRRGVALGAAGLGAVLAEGFGESTIRAGLLETAVRSASASAVPVPVAVSSLADGVVKAMYLKKLKMVSMIGLSLALASGGWRAVGPLGQGADPRMPTVAVGTDDRSARPSPAGPTGDDPVRAAFDRLVAADGNWQKEKPALDELKALGEQSKDLLVREAKRHPKERIRDYCYELITDQFPKDERVIEQATRGLSDESYRVRYRLAFWLGSQKVFAAHRKLRNVMEDPKEEERVRLTAAKSLAELGERDVIRQLYFGLESDSYMDRHIAHIGVKVLSGKSPDDFGGYQYGEGASVSGGAEFVGAFNALQRAEKRLKRYEAIKAYLEWLKAEKPELFKHLAPSN